MKVTIWHGCKVVVALDLPDDSQPHDKAIGGEVSIDPWARLASTVGSPGDYRSAPTEFS